MAFLRMFKSVQFCSHMFLLFMSPAPLLLLSAPALHSGKGGWGCSWGGGGGSSFGRWMGSDAHRSSSVLDSVPPARSLRSRKHMLQAAAPTDRWTAKSLAYPCFDRHFVEALLRTRLSNLQLVLAMEVDSPGMFAGKAFEWTAKLAPTEH